VVRVAFIKNVLVGFAELTDDGHVDCMYVHKDYQGRSIAHNLLEELLQLAQQRNYEVLTTESSITAKPFFEKHGFNVTHVKKKLYNGKEFTNYIMIKQL
jgi:putative acetyltransferase